MMVDDKSEVDEVTETDEGKQVDDPELLQDMMDLGAEIDDKSDDVEEADDVSDADADADADADDSGEDKNADDKKVDDVSDIDTLDTPLTDSIDEQVDKAGETPDVLEFSEDSILSDEVKKDISGFVSDRDIDDESIGLLGDILEKSTQSGFNTAKDMIIAEQTKRRDAVLADPMFKGDAAKETKLNIDEVVNRFGGDDAEGLKKFFDGHHSFDLSLIRSLNRIGQALRERPNDNMGQTVNMKNADTDMSADDRQVRKEYAAFFEG